MKKMPPPNSRKKCIFFLEFHCFSWRNPAKYTPKIFSGASRQIQKKKKKMRRFLLPADLGKKMKKMAPGLDFRPSQFQKKN